MAETVSDNIASLLRRVTVGEKDQRLQACTELQQALMNVHDSKVITYQVNFRRQNALVFVQTLFHKGFFSFSHSDATLSPFYERWKNNFLTGFFVFMWKS